MRHRTIAYIKALWWRALHSSFRNVPAAVAASAPTLVSDFSEAAVRCLSS